MQGQSGPEDRLVALERDALHHAAKAVKALDEPLSTLEVLDLNTAIATKGGLLRRDYGRSHGVGLNEALIAATTQEHGLQLCTLNVKHYPALGKEQLKRAYVKNA